MVEPAGTGPRRANRVVGQAGNQAEPGHTTTEPTVPRALLDYLLQTWATDPHPSSAPASAGQEERNSCHVRPLRRAPAAGDQESAGPHAPVRYRRSRSA